MSKYTENFPNLSTYDFNTIMCQLKQVCGADPSGMINAQFLSRPTTAKDIAQLIYCTYYIMQGSENLQKQYVELYTFVRQTGCIVLQFHTPHLLWIGTAAPQKRNGAATCPEIGAKFSSSRHGKMG